MPNILTTVSPIALVSLGILLFEHCTTVTLTRYTQQRTDAPRAAPVVIVFLTECLKLVLALYLELTTSYGLGSGSQLRELKSAIVDAPRDTLRVSVPAGLYTLQNILIFVALGNLEVVSFQVLYQTKLMLTAVLSVLMLGRTLTVRQWVSLALLTVGVVAVELSDGNLRSVASSGENKSGRQLQQLQYSAGVAAAGPEPLSAMWMQPSQQDAAMAFDGGRQLSGGHHGSHKHPHKKNGASTSEAPPPRAPLLGVIAALCAASLSSFAGVYFEALVKGKEVAPPSLWVRNVQLCLFTIPLAAFAVLAKWETVMSNGHGNALHGIVEFVGQCLELVSTH